jgi:hypothetical protein
VGGPTVAADETVRHDTASEIGEVRLIGDSTHAVADDRRSAEREPTRVP